MQIIAEVASSIDFAAADGLLRFFFAMLLSMPCCRHSIFDAARFSQR